MLVIFLAEQVLTGKIKLSQIGNNFNLHDLVKAKIAEMLNVPVEEIEKKIEG